ncbi:MAG: transglycosylase SLT domain-containing protein [Bacteroidaceae bacterium]|nr:transglycosylase SLT domain-containing protein [Bacteroidaceae bacterium]
MSSTFSKQSVDELSAELDLPEIQATGELIGGTLSGPDTYFEYRGMGFGLQYEIAEEFGHVIGARVRMEVAHDTTELLTMLSKGDIDFICMDMPEQPDMERCVNNWLTRSSSPELARAVNDWYEPTIIHQIKLRHQQRNQQVRTVRRKARPVILNASRGQISQFDAILKRQAQRIGWDWRLLAAQCYQESAFDPKAVSWAGAQGLMQIMPGTAAHLGLNGTAVWEPDANITAGAQYLKELSTTFSDIANPSERIRFTLAAYNGGAGHIRDAMALAKNEGRNVQRWTEVVPFVLRLSQARYYRNPVVKYGYMRGSETVDYVAKIEERWRQYRQAVH